MSDVNEQQQQSTKRRLAAARPDSAPSAAAARNHAHYAAALVWCSKSAATTLVWLPAQEQALYEVSLLYETIQRAGLNDTSAVQLPARALLASVVVSAHVNASDARDARTPAAAAANTPTRSECRSVHSARVQLHTDDAAVVGQPTRDGATCTARQQRRPNTTATRETLSAPTATTSHLLKLAILAKTSKQASKQASKRLSSAA